MKNVSIITLAGKKMIDRKTKNQIEATLNKIRPFIQRDGGDVHLAGFEDGIVYLEMSGACADCAFIDSTISDGIEIILMEEVPGIIGVKQAHDMPESARIKSADKSRNKTK